jgi:gliding motility-associated-like protein
MRLFTPIVCFVWCLLLAATTTLHGQVFNTPDNPPIVVDGHLQRHLITPGSEHSFLTVQNLLPGQTYSLIAPPGDIPFGNCMPDIAALDPEAKVLGYDATSHQMRFVANAAEMKFRLDYYCSWDPANPPTHYISIYCESCKKKKLKDALKSLAVIDVQNGGADDLVRNTLIGGDCFDITGITFSGQSGQIGTFTNGQTNVGFNTGMIMATGDITVAIGPNDQDNASAGYGVSTPDSDLGTLTGGATFDMADVEFDFTPTQSPVTFNFVFASEEYCEYVNSAFNDVFGFFISGPGFAGTTDIALIPATNIPVEINTVNHLSNSGFYKNNTPASGILCGQNPSVSPATNELQFDGLTTQMVAVANVQTCQTYHIKLKVADVGDGIYDSAVFLKAGSFDAGGNASVNWEVNNDPDNHDAHEGCETVKLVFHRVGGNPNIPMTVGYTVTGTATPGADYSPIPGVVVIPSGQTEYTITVTINVDNLTEGTETIIITLNNPCSCLHPQEILNIHDLPILSAIPDTTNICGAGVATLGVTPVSGVEPYTYHWSTGANTQVISQFTAISTNYKVTVTDACGKTTVVTARVIVNPPPLGQMFGPAPQLCPGGTATLVVHFMGTGPFTLDYNFNGNAQTPITDITDNPYNLVVTEIGLYSLFQVTDGNGCVGTGQGTLLVQPSNLNLTGIVTNVTCNGLANGSINTTATGGTGPYSYNWTGPTNIGNVADPVNLKAGNYTVTVTDGFGCQLPRPFTVNEPPPLAPTVANAQGPNCTNPTGGNITLTVSGGTPNYTFVWSNGTTAQNPTNLAAGTYTVTVTDQANCTKTTTASVTGDFTPPVAAGTPSGSITCINPSVSIDGSGSSTGPNFNYNWTASPGGVISSGATTLNPIVAAPGTYTLLVTNTSNGCTASKPVIVNGNINLPTAAAGPNGTLTCVLTNLTLDGTGSSTGPIFTYNWTASPGGVISGGGTSLNPIVSAPGTYTIVVTNTTNGCTQSDDVVVDNNTNLPTASVANPPLLTCTNSTITLNGGGSTPAANLTYQWSTSNGNILSGQTTPNAVVNEPGQYTLVVTNSTNGCTDSKTATVDQDNSLPVANASAPNGLNCNIKQVTINGAGTSTGAGFTFTWTASPGGHFVSGQTTLTPTVDAPGTYTLVVINTANNCSSSASVLIDQDIQAPAVNAGSPSTLNCTTTTLTLGDPNAATGANLGYNWTGTGITGGANTPTPTVDQPGTYVLVVTNSTNGCTSTDNVVIAQDITHPTAVVAPGGQLNCTTPALQLNGAGSSTGAAFTYIWTPSNGGNIGAGGNTLTPTVTTAGTYTLLISNTGNGCTSTVSTTVTSNANLPVATAIPSDTITCAVPNIILDAAGSSTGPNFKYQWGTIDGQITGGQGTLQATVSAAGLYTLIVTNTANNCSSSFSVQVNADIAAPVADAGTSQILDCTQPSLTLNGTNSSVGAIYTYNWTASNGGILVPPTNVANPKVSAAGDYQLVVTNTLNGCTTAATVNIKADANQPVTTIATPATLNCLINQTVLNASGSSTGGNITYAWNGPGIVSGFNALNATINLPGDYSLTITNNTNGCTSSQTVTVKQDVTPPPVDAGPDVNLDCNIPQAQLGGPNNPTGPNYIFNWTGTGIVSGANTPTPVINQGGTFVLVVTNNTNGCTSTDDITATTNFTNPQADAGQTFELTCVKPNYTLAATASQGPTFTYSWTTNGGHFTTATNILTPTVDGAGYYYLVVTDQSNGCTTTSSVHITQSPDVPIATATSPGTLTCAVPTLNLSGSGSSTGPTYSYVWSTQDGHIISGDTTLTLKIDQPGSYTLVVTNSANSCTSTSSIQVDQDINPPSIDPGPSPTITCVKLSVPLAGSVNTTGTFTYQWQASNGGNIVSGGTTLTPIVNAGGQYNLTVTSQQNGCTSSGFVQVQVDKAPPAALIQSPDTLTCTVQQLPLDASASSTGNMTYAWTVANGGHIADQTNQLKPVVDKPGNYTLLVTNNDNGCTKSITVPVAQNIQHPVANAGPNGLLTCAITSLKLDGSGSSQNGNFFYQWTTPDGQILVGANSLSPTIVADGHYTLVVTDNSNGCTSVANTVVDINNKPPGIAVASPPVITCTNAQITIDGSGSQTGGTIKYVWTTTDGNIVSGQNASQVVVNKAGTYTLTVLNSATGCSSTQAVTVSDNIVLPVAEAGPAFTLTCTTTQGALKGTGSTGSIYTYTWTTADGHIVSGANTLSPVVNKEGTYQLTVANQTTGCVKTDNVVIDRQTNVPTDFADTLKNPTCKDNDGFITFGPVTGGFGPYLYSIDGGKTFVSTIDFAAISPGTYDLYIQDVNGCEFHKSLSVPKAPDPAISIDPKFSIELGDSLKLNAVLPTGYPFALIDSIVWAPLDGLTFKYSPNPIQNLKNRLSPWAKPLRPIQYTVTLISKDGCQASDRLIIDVNTEPHIYIPNAFSPWNQDGKNDVVYIFADGSQVVRINKFQIFDRWGEMMYQAYNFLPNDPSHGWDGRLGGKYLDPGVFVYYAEILLIDGRILLYKGDVTLVR